MEQDELQIEVERLVDRKLETFRHEIRLELMPIKLTVAAHTDQMAELRASTAQLSGGLARIEGAQAAGKEDDRRYQKELGEKLDTSLALLHAHIGRQAGVEVEEQKVEAEGERKRHAVREWIKVVGAVVSVSAVVKVLGELFVYLSHVHLFQ